MMTKEKFVSTRTLWTIWSLALILLILGGCGMFLLKPGFVFVSCELIAYVGTALWFLFSTELYLSKQHQAIQR